MNSAAARLGDLPGEGPRSRFSRNRKALVTQAVDAGLISEGAACTLYAISPDEFAEWQGYAAGLPVHEGAVLVQAGSMLFDIATGGIQALEGETPKLASSPTKIVLALAACAGRIVTRQMLHRVLGHTGSITYGKVLDVQIYNIRAAFAGRCHVQTVWGRGFRLDGDVIG